MKTLFIEIAAIALLLATLTATAQQRTLTVTLTNLNGTPVVGATLFLNDANNTTAQTDSNGVATLTTEGYPVNAPVFTDNRPTTFTREIITLNGQTVSRDRITLPGNTRTSAQLKPNTLYLEKLTGDDNQSSTTKIVTNNRGELPGGTAQQLQAQLKSGSFGYRVTVQPDPQNKTFADTVIAVSGWEKEWTTYNTGLQVNEFIKIGDNYKNGLDTILNSAFVEFDLTKLFPDDNYNNVAFEFTNGFENYVSIDSENKTITLDRSKAPLKGNFEIFATDIGNNKTNGLNISYNENASFINIIVKNSVTSELMTNADVYLNSFSNHFSLSNLLKDKNGYIQLFTNQTTDNIVRVDGDLYGYVDMKNSGDTINAFVAPNDFPMVFYNDLNRVGEYDLVKWPKGEQLTLRVLTVDEKTNLTLPDPEIQKLATFGDTLEFMMAEKGIYDTPFSNMNIAYIDTFDYKKLVPNSFYTMFDGDETGNGAIGFYYKKEDNVRIFTGCVIDIIYPMNDHNTFIGMFQEYMSAIYGRAPPLDINIPEDGSLFKESGSTTYITDSDVKIIKHHINQENGSWFANDTNTGKGIEISQRAVKINNKNELIPYVLRYK